MPPKAQPEPQQKPPPERYSRRSQICWIETEYDQVAAHAQAAGLTVSEFVRRAALARRIVSIADAQLSGELRRIGAMLKHLYPKVATWTASEKARYWHTRNRLLSLAKEIRGRL